MFVLAEILRRARKMRAHRELQLLNMFPEITISAMQFLSMEQIGWGSDSQCKSMPCERAQKIRQVAIKNFLRQAATCDSACTRLCYSGCLY